MDASISKLYTVGYALSKMMPGLEVMHQFVRNLSLAEPRNLDQILQRFLEVLRQRSFSEIF